MPKVESLAGSWLSNDLVVHVQHPFIASCLRASQIAFDRAMIGSQRMEWPGRKQGFYQALSRIAFRLRRGIRLIKLTSRDDVLSNVTVA